MSGKIKMTQRAVINSYRKVYRAGYCDLQRLLRYMDPIGYNEGYCGWNCDFYLFPEKDVAIVTGYSFHYNVPIISQEMCDKYENLATEIADNVFYDYETKYRKTNQLVFDLIEELEKPIKK